MGEPTGSDAAAPFVGDRDASRTFRISKGSQPRRKVDQQLILRQADNLTGGEVMPAGRRYCPAVGGDDTGVRGFGTGHAATHVARLYRKRDGGSRIVRRFDGAAVGTVQDIGRAAGGDRGFEYV